MSERVTAVSLHGDGSAVVVGYADGRLDLVELGAQPRSRGVPGLDGPIESIAGRERWRLAAGREGGAILVDLEAGTVVDRLDRRVLVVDAALPGDGTAVVVTADGQVLRWSPTNEEHPQLTTLSVPGACDGVSCDAAGGLVVTQGFRWWSWPGGAPRPHSVSPADFDARALAHNVGRVVPVPGGRRVLVYWDDVRVFEAADGRCVAELMRTRAPGDVRLAGEADLLAVGSIYGKLLVHDLQGTVYFDREVTPDEIVQVSVSDDGGRVAFADLNGGAAVLDVRTRTTVLSHVQLLEIRDPAAGV